MTNKQNTPLVSVIMPAYNHEKYVQDAISSIIEQTYENIELIIIDDGSNDSTWDKIREMESTCKKRFCKVIFETQKNQGTCKTINKLLLYANGKYIYFIDSDDISLNQVIEKEVNFLETNNDYALVVGDNSFIDEHSRPVYLDKNGELTYDMNAIYKKASDFYKSFRPEIMDNFGSYESLYKGNYIPNGYMVKKSIFDKIGKFSPKAPLEDHWMMLQISKYAKIKYLDEVLLLYRRHSENTINNKKHMVFMAEKTFNWEYNFVKSIKDKSGIDNIVFQINKNDFKYDGWYIGAATEYPAETLWLTLIRKRFHNPEYISLWISINYKLCKSKLRKFLIEHKLYKLKQKKDK